MAALQQAVRLKTDFADAYNSLGSALYQAQQFDQAIEAYKKALSLKPKRGDTTTISARFTIEPNAIRKQ